MAYEDSSRAAYGLRQHERSKEYRNGLQGDLDTVRPPRYGKIVEVFQAVDKAGQVTIMVDIQFFDEPQSNIQRRTYNRVFVLEHSATDLALLYGSLEDVIVDANGDHRIVEVRQIGDRPDQGVARIVNRNGLGDLEKANKLRDFGTIMAPAGAGL